MSDEIHLSCSFPNETLLYMAYMPFLLGGGLFIRSSQVLPLGAKVNLLVNLPNESETYSVESKVVWITPRGSQANKPAGIGLQFTGENNQQFMNKIETCLAGLLKSSQTTDTM